MPNKIINDSDGTMRVWDSKARTNVDVKPGESITLLKGDAEHLLARQPHIWSKPEIPKPAKGDKKEDE